MQGSCLYKHNASLVRYNQTRFADSKYCGFVKTVVANMEKVIRICKDSFSPQVPPAASAPTSSSSSIAPRRAPVLFKMLLNGEEARLPLETGNWPYYDWQAFKARYGR